MAKEAEPPKIGSQDEDPAMVTIIPTGEEEKGDPRMTRRMRGGE
jgi:hypothetical protein